MPKLILSVVGVLMIAGFTYPSLAQTSQPTPRPTSAWKVTDDAPSGVRTAMEEAKAAYDDELTRGNREMAQLQTLLKEATRAKDRERTSEIRRKIAALREDMRLNPQASPIPLQWKDLGFAGDVGRVGTNPLAQIDTIIDQSTMIATPTAFSHHPPPPDPQRYARFSVIVRTNTKDLHDGKIWVGGSGLWYVSRIQKYGENSLPVWEPLDLTRYLIPPSP